MDPTLALTTTLHLALSSGQVAGQGNVVLQPKSTWGATVDVNVKALPELETRLDGSAVVGSVRSADKAHQQGLQEVRAQAWSVYNFHVDPASRAGVGLYTDMALPAHHHLPLPQSLPDGVYAAEEGEVSHRQTLLGVELKVSTQSDRMRTDLHNIWFFSGNRIAPNLVTYKPMLGFKWHNAYRFTGEPQGHTGLSLLTDVDFYFARKSGVSALNMHDGLGGTKREILLAYGLRYDFNEQSAVSLQSYGYNNLNRGNSATTPTQFRDGFRLTLEHRL